MGSISESAPNPQDLLKQRQTLAQRKHGNTYKLFALLLGVVLLGWTVWTTIRYFIAVFLNNLDPVIHSLNLVFFIVSLLAAISFICVLFLLPFIQRPPIGNLTIFFILLNCVMSFAIVAVAALQIVIFELWRNSDGTRGFIGRCGWDMDAVWGSAGGLCGTYVWNGWVGVLCARFGGTVLLVVLYFFCIYQTITLLQSASDLLLAPSSPPTIDEHKETLKHYQRRRRSVHPAAETGPIYGLYPEQVQPQTDYVYHHQYPYPLPQQHHTQQHSETPGARFDTPVASPPATMVRQYLPAAQTIPLQPALRMLPSAESVSNAGGGRRISPPGRKPVDYSKLAVNSPPIPSPTLDLLDPSLDPRFSSTWARNESTSAASSPYDEEFGERQLADSAAQERHTMPFVPSVLQTSVPTEDDGVDNKRNTAYALQEFVFPLTTQHPTPPLPEPRSPQPQPLAPTRETQPTRPSIAIPPPPAHSPSVENIASFQSIMASPSGVLAVPKNIRQSVVSDSSNGSTSSTTSSMGQQLPSSQHMPSSSLAPFFATSSSSNSVSQVPRSQSPPRTLSSPGTPGQTFGPMPSASPKPQIFVRMGDGRLVRKLSTIGSVGTAATQSGDEAGALKKRRRDSSDIGGYSSEEDAESIIHFPSTSGTSRNLVQGHQRPLSGSSSQLDSIAEQLGGGFEGRNTEIWLNDPITSDEERRRASRSLDIQRPTTTYSADESDTGMVTAQEEVAAAAGESPPRRRNSSGGVFGGWWSASGERGEPRK